MMSVEIEKVKTSLKRSFPSASNIFVDPTTKECEVTVSVDDYQGDIEGHLMENGVRLTCVDYNDQYPFKYVFMYKIKS